MKELWWLLKTISFKYTHSGDCVGADASFIVAASYHDAHMIGHPCTIASMRAYLVYDEERAPKAPLERNKDICHESDLLIACPATNQEELRSGTWATVRYMRKLGKSIIIIKPSGKIERENIAI